jgi:hypothetical protein
MTGGTAVMTIQHSPDLKELDEFISSQRRRETRLRWALQRILSAAEGDPRFQPMNWSDVAELARQALEESGGGPTTVANGG